MRFRVTLLSVLAVIGFVVAVCPSAWAGTNGNIRGKITDIQTNEGLPLVNVLIVGSGRGGVTNDKGEYFITGVQAGVYTIRASLLGYQVFEAKKVSIDADETSVLDFKLASTLIHLQQAVVFGMVLPEPLIQSPFRHRLAPRRIEASAVRYPEQPVFFQDLGAVA